MRTTEITKLDQIPVGTIVTDAAGHRSKVTDVAPSPTTPGMLVHTAITLEPIDQIAIEPTPRRPTRWGGHHLAQHHRILAPRPGEDPACDTEQWYTDHVQPDCPETQRPALRRAWLGTP